MRFLTMNWWAGDDTADRGAEYEAHLERIWDRLPSSVQELSRIPFHDTNLTRLTLSIPARELLLHMELAGTKSGSNLLVRYRDVEQFNTTGGADEGLAGPGGYGDLGYDEVDITGAGRFIHRLLFSSGIELEITFGDVEIEEVASSAARAEVVGE